MATFYFNGAVDGEWTELGNWWTDSDFTVQATSLPTSSDSVVASAGISSNSGSEPTLVDFTLGDPTSPNLVLGIPVTVTGTATFNDSSYNYGTVNGDATFNDYSTNFYGTVNGDATFNDNSYNSATVTGDATFNDSSLNNGILNGNNIFNHNSTNGPNGGANLTETSTSSFRDSSFAYPKDLWANGSLVTENYNTYAGTVIFENRTTYPIPRGINGSSLLGVI